MGGERRDPGHEPSPPARGAGGTDARGAPARRGGRRSRRRPRRRPLARRRATGERGRAGAPCRARAAGGLRAGARGRRRTRRRADPLQRPRGAGRGGTRARRGRLRPGSCAVRMPRGNAALRVGPRARRARAAGGPAANLVERDRRPRAGHRPRRAPGGGRADGRGGAGLRRLGSSSAVGHERNRAPDARRRRGPRSPRAAGVETPRGRHARHDPGGGRSRHGGLRGGRGVHVRRAHPHPAHRRGGSGLGGGARGVEALAGRARRAFPEPAAGASARQPPGADRRGARRRSRCGARPLATGRRHEGGRPPRGRCAFEACPPCASRGSGRRPIESCTSPPPAPAATTVACSGRPTSVAGPCAEAARGLAVRGAEGYDPAEGMVWKDQWRGDMRRLRLRRWPDCAACAGARPPASVAARRSRESARHSGWANPAKQSTDHPGQGAGARRRVLSRWSRPNEPTALARAAATPGRGLSAARVRAHPRADRRCRDFCER